MPMAPTRSSTPPAPLPRLLLFAAPHPPWQDDQENNSMPHCCSLAGLPQLRRLCAQTTLFLSPIQEAPLSLGELLNWFSEVSKSWISSSGGPDTTAPLLQPPTKCCWMSISTSFLVAADLVPSSRLPGEGENSHFAATLEQLIGAVATALGPILLEQGREGAPTPERDLLGGLGEAGVALCLAQTLGWELFGL